MLKPYPQATVNVTLFRDRAFADQVQVRTLGRVLSQQDWCPCKKGKFGHRGRQAQRKGKEAMAVSQQRQRLEWCPQAKEHQGSLGTDRSWKRQREILPESPQRKHGPSDNLTLDFQPPEL